MGAGSLLCLDFLHIQAVYFATLKSAYLGAKSGILAVGINGNPALSTFRSWLTAGGISEPVTYITSTTDIAAANFSRYKVLYVPSAYINNGGVTVNGIKDVQVLAPSPEITPTGVLSNTPDGQLSAH